MTLGTALFGAGTVVVAHLGFGIPPHLAALAVLLAFILCIVG